jgi:hypothetical protein
MGCAGHPAHLPERWLSGRKRRFAKSVTGLFPSAGSNPVLSAPKETRLASSLSITTCGPLVFSCPGFVPVGNLLVETAFLKIVPVIDGDWYEHQITN